MKLPVVLSRVADIVGTSAGFSVFGLLLGGITGWEVLPSLSAVGAWAALRLAERRGFVEFVAVLPPRVKPPQLALPPSKESHDPLRPVAAPRAKAAALLSLRTPQGWSVLPAVLLVAGVLVFVAGELHRAAVLTAGVGTIEAFGLRLGGWDLAGRGLIGLAAAVGLAEFLRAWRGTRDE
ncbi:MAG: hypothetical protein HYZ75_11250 [Elusimicrobia bacterium]|nr:hypothetical protein [Elusimicrobiota bacterium]